MSEKKSEFDTLYELLQETRGTIKDLRVLLKEAKRVTIELRAAVPTEFRDLMDEVAAAEFGRFSQEVSQHIDEATDAVMRRFDTIAEILLGTNKAAQRKGESLEEAAMQVRGVVDAYFEHAKEKR